MCWAHRSFLLQVPHPELQHNIMIEAVENHMPVRPFCLIHTMPSVQLPCKKMRLCADRGPFLTDSCALFHTPPCSPG